jgi:hypothetical protein
VVGKVPHRRPESLWIPQVCRDLDVRCIEQRRGDGIHQRQEGQNLFCGVALRNGVGRAENARELFWLFADLHYDSLKSMERFLVILAKRDRI